MRYLFVISLAFGGVEASNAKGLTFLEEKEKEEGVRGTGSGLLYKVLRWIFVRLFFSRLFFITSPTGKGLGKLIR